MHLWRLAVRYVIVDIRRLKVKNEWRVYTPLNPYASHSVYREPLPVLLPLPLYIAQHPPRPESSATLHQPHISLICAELSRLATFGK